jgi:hypothetical protein
MIDSHLTFKFGVDNFVVDSIDDHASTRAVDDEVTYRFVFFVIIS